MFEPPHGAFFVGYLDDRPGGHGRLAPSYRREAYGTGRTAEVKRMYVAPAPPAAAAWPGRCSPTSRTPPAPPAPR